LHGVQRCRPESRPGQAAQKPALARAPGYLKSDVSAFAEAAQESLPPYPYLRKILGQLSKLPEHGHPVLKVPCFRN
jgi:hypothetical protein